MTIDVFRWALILTALACAGATSGLFIRVGRTALPAWRMRGLFACNIGIMGSIALLVHQRLGQPVSGGHTSLGLFAAAEFVFLVGIWRWYGTEEGKAHARRMTEPR